MTTSMTIIKCDAHHVEQLRYQGTLHKQDPHAVVILAHWTMPRRDLGYTCFEPGDVFIEYFYPDRWFNIFAIYEHNMTFKGWYCNITEPAHIQHTIIEQIDLFLDIWVNPDGTTLLLDEDEFTTTTMLSPQQRQGALQGQQDLLDMISRKQGVFAQQ